MPELGPGRVFPSPAEEHAQSEVVTMSGKMKEDTLTTSPRRGCYWANANHLFVDPHAHMSVLLVGSIMQAQPWGVPVLGSFPMHSSHSLVHGVFFKAAVMPSPGQYGAVAAPMYAAGLGHGQAE